MTIWEYPAPEQATQRASWLLREVRYSWKCPFCASIDLVRWVNNSHTAGKSHGLPNETALDSMLEAIALDETYVRTDTNIYVLACPGCGWWCAVHTTDTLRIDDFDLAPSPVRTVKGTVGNLLRLSHDDLSDSIAAAKQSLLSKFRTARSEIDPSVFEDVVASILKDMGFRTRVTGRTNDGGIDIILDGPENSIVGVQVKRYKNSIEVEQIRSFVGALVLKGYTRGLFVTTSEFQAGGERTTSLAQAKGLFIELVDSKGFLEALQVNMRRMYTSPDELLERYTEHLLHLDEYELESKDPNDEIWI